MQRFLRASSAVVLLCSMSSVAHADDVLSPLFVVSLGGVFLLLTIGVGALLGMFAASRGKPAWVPLSYLVPVIFVADLAMNLMSPYLSVLQSLPLAIMQTLFFSGPIAAGPSSCMRGACDGLAKPDHSTRYSKPSANT